MFYGEIPARFTVTSVGRRIVSGDEVLNTPISTVGASLSRDLLILALVTAAARPDVASQSSSTATVVRDTTVGGAAPVFDAALSRSKQATVVADEARRLRSF